MTRPGIDGCVIMAIAPLLGVAFLVRRWNGWFFPMVIVAAVLLRHKVSREGYQRVTETFGLLPSLDWGDNLRQGAFVAAVSGVLYGLGRLFGPEQALVSLLVGISASLVFTGVRLMVEWNARHR